MEKIANLKFFNIKHLSFDEMRKKNYTSKLNKPLATSVIINKTNKKSIIGRKFFIKDVRRLHRHQTNETERNQNLGQVTDYTTTKGEINFLK